MLFTFRVAVGKVSVAPPKFPQFLPGLASNEQALNCFDYSCGEKEELSEPRAHDVSNKYIAAVIFPSVCIKRFCPHKALVDGKAGDESQNCK